MTRAKSLTLCAALCALLAFFVPAHGAGAANGSGNAQTSTPTAHAVSSPLRDAPTASRGKTQRHEKDLPSPRAATLNPASPEGAGQTGFTAFPTSPNIPTTPTPGVNFAGADDTTCGCAPSDSNLAVGATQVVQWVNNALSVYDKNGTLITGPVAGNAVFSGLGNECTTDNDGDPVVKYDQVAHRWLLAQFAIGSSPYLECVAVSTSSDATGTYNAWSYSFGTQFPDYPKWSVWPASGTDAYFASYNLFQNGATFSGADACAYNREAMLSGSASPAQVCFLQPTIDTMLPSDLDGGAGVPGSTALPPSGEPGHFVSLDTNALDVWQLQPSWGSTATLTGPATLTTAGFAEACGGGVCVPQRGTARQLDTLADRLMYRLAYRNFGDHESLVVSHSVSGPSGTAAPRWYELRQTTNAPGITYAGSGWSIYQQSTYAPDASYRWMSSAAMDRMGDIAIGYSKSSSSMYPAIDYAARSATDPLNNLRPEVQLKAGGGAQNGNVNRWGDYTSMAIDPTNDCAFWYTDQYEPTSGSLNWATWIGSFTMPNCNPAGASGNWVGTYGSAGYAIGGWSGGSTDAQVTPAMTLTVSQASRWQWAAGTGDQRALQSADQSTRNATTWYDPNAVALSLTFTTAYNGPLDLYAVDYEARSRQESVAVTDSNGTQTATLTSFQGGAWVADSVHVTAGATLGITVTRLAGVNAVLSGVFLGSPGQPPTPTGNWVGMYGSTAFAIGGWNGGSSDVQVTPAMTLSVTQAAPWQWAGNTSDLRALQSADQATRNATTWYDPNAVKLSLTFTNAYNGPLNLYAVDFEARSRQESVAVTDSSSTQPATLTAFQGGQWVTDTVHVSAGGTLSITVTRTAGVNAVLSGIFLGAPAAPATPPGNWVGTFGSTAYALGGWNGGGSDAQVTPAMTLALTQGARWQWAANTGDPRALLSAEQTTRNATTWYDANAVTLTLTFTNAYTGPLDLYAVDFEARSRQESVAVTDSGSTQTATLTAFQGGAWIADAVHVNAGAMLSITVTRTAGVNAVLSGIFLGPAGGAAAATGNWVGTYGSTAFAIGGWNGGSSDVQVTPGITLSVTQASRYEWAATTADTRALQSADQSWRSATTWYDPSAVTLSLTFSNAYNGPLDLYAVDYEPRSRQETVAVNDSGGTRTTTLTAFQGGAWVADTIHVNAGATVTITVTRVAGVNAVLSGIFLGGPGNPA